VLSTRAPLLTVAQLLEYGRRMNTRWDADYARERLRRHNIPLERKAGALASGQQAQVSLALALGKRPDLLLRDEPMANLDPLARQEFLRTMLGAAAEDKTTILFSSHVVSELGRFCDYLIVLAGGRVRLAGDLDELLAGHRRLTAESDTSAARLTLPGVVSATSTGGETSLLVRTDAWDPSLSRIGWQEDEICLDDLVLAYMDPESAMSDLAERLTRPASSRAS
jgi:ABC-2 type transport system ATP-binding protein